MLGWQTSLVGTALAPAQLFQAMVVLYNPSFATKGKFCRFQIRAGSASMTNCSSDKGWLGTLITIALTCIATLVNVFGYKKLPILEGTVIPLYFVVCVALVGDPFNTVIEALADSQERSSCFG